jgi:LysM repeat protein
MGSQPARNSARLLVPVALAVFAVMFFAVILSSGSSDNKKDNRAAATSAKQVSKSTQKSQPRKPTASTYTVKIGDNLPAIAEKTGLTVAKIQELNPALDPYGLQSGQKIKLRE